MQWKVASAAVAELRDQRPVEDAVRGVVRERGPRAGHVVQVPALQDAIRDDRDDRERNRRAADQERAGREQALAGALRPAFTGQAGSASAQLSFELSQKFQPVTIRMAMAFAT